MCEALRVLTWAVFCAFAPSKAIDVIIDTYHVYISIRRRCLPAAQKLQKMHSMANRDKFSSLEWGSAQTPDRDKQPPDGFDEGAESAGLFDPIEPDDDANPG